MSNFNFNCNCDGINGFKHSMIMVINRLASRLYIFYLCLAVYKNILYQLFLGTVIILRDPFIPLYVLIQVIRMLSHFLTTTLPLAKSFKTKYFLGMLTLFNCYK